MVPFGRAGSTRGVDQQVNPTGTTVHLRDPEFYRAALRVVLGARVLGEFGDELLRMLVDRYPDPQTGGRPRAALVAHARGPRTGSAAGGSTAAADTAWPIAAERGPAGAVGGEVADLEGDPAKLDPQGARTVTAVQPASIGSSACTGADARRTDCPR
jgi:hypothetical protein